MMRLANRLSQSKRRITQLPIKAASRLTPSRYRGPFYVLGKRGADVRPDFNWTRTQRGWVIVEAS